MILSLKKNHLKSLQMAQLHWIKQYVLGERLKYKNNKEFQEFKSFKSLFHKTLYINKYNDI